MSYEQRMKEAHQALDEFVTKFHELQIPVYEVVIECVGDAEWKTPFGNVLVRPKKVDNG